MRLYLLSQDEFNDYDTYDAIIVCAENIEDAKSISPSGGKFIEGDRSSGWATKKENIKCEEIGIAFENQKRGIILASFNAG
jgi:hypothetical protein